MADILTPNQRSAMMSRIRSRNTRPELVVRSVLHRLGYRFRLHSRTLPGHPDIVLPRHRTVVLVHGCFWHHHSGCRFAYTPKTRRDFWSAKFKANMERDRRTQKALRRAGWQVLIIWECQTRDLNRLARSLKTMLNPATAQRSP
jgi:DNA mismatch endonuclease (patch repair protein)